MGSPAYDAAMGALLRSVTHAHRLLHRASGGRLGRRWPGGAEVIWLTTRGRHSGRLRTVPLLAARDAAGTPAAWVVAGSNVGQERLPGWVHNLRADPDALVERAGVRAAVRAVEVHDPAEWQRCFDLMVGIWRGYAGYRRRTDRAIPVFRLVPPTTHGVPS